MAITNPEESYSCKVATCRSKPDRVRRSEYQRQKLGSKITLINQPGLRYIRVGYNLDFMRQSACRVLNPITVYSYGSLFNCTTVGQASDPMTALT